MAASPGQVLEVPQHPGAEAGAAPVVVHPHPLDLAGLGVERPDAAVRHRSAVAGRHHERAGLVGPARVEAAREAAVELGEVGARRLLGDRVGGRHLTEVDRRRANQEVGGREGVDQAGALAGRQRLDESAGQ